MASQSDRRPQLPALSYLDVDKAHRNDDESSLPRKSDSAVGRRETSSSSPPASQYSTAPPPSISRSQPPSGWSGQGSRPRTPPESRSARDSDIENLKQVMRQSLPSITEALNMEAEQEYGHGSASRRHQPAATSMPRSRQDAPPSPQQSTKRPYGMEPPQSQSPYGGVEGHANHQSRDLYGAAAYTPSESRATGYHAASDARSSMSSQNSSNHHPVQHPSNRPPSQYEQHQPSPAPGGAPPPPSSVPYGYTPYSPRYPQHAAPPSSAAGPVYQPSRDYEAPRSSSMSGWKPDNVSRYSDDRAGASYGDSVKRHLEMYDLEAALNEISSTSRIVQDFSRRYGEHMHQTSRTGPDPSTLPSLVEVDDMIHKSRTQHDALIKIRNVVVTEKMAYEQQMAEQRAASTPRPKAQFATDAPGPRPNAPPLPRPAPHEMPPPGHETGEGGFAGGESKKLRRGGRAAPPGRCHSCNRMETPEWRRGPDGARTLCNACGLHYAKLTRKQSNANKAAHAGSSNLRPKE